jgi:hypothetical protein
MDEIWMTEYDLEREREELERFEAMRDLDEMEKYKAEQEMIEVYLHEEFVRKGWLRFMRVMGTIPAWSDQSHHILDSEVVPIMAWALETEAFKRDYPF